MKATLRHIYLCRVASIPEWRVPSLNKSNPIQSLLLERGSTEEYGWSHGVPCFPWLPQGALLANIPCNSQTQRTPCSGYVIILNMRSLPFLAQYNCSSFKLEGCHVKFIHNKNASEIPGHSPVLDPSCPPPSHSSNPPVDQRLPFVDPPLQATCMHQNKPVFGKVIGRDTVI